MADENKLAAERRDRFGKGAARRLRASGRIPAVIYGHGSDPQHVSLPGHEVSLILRKANQVLDLDLDGKSQLALVKDVQKDPVHQIIEHLDLIVVRRGEKVTVDVPVHVEGESGPGTIVVQDAGTVALEVEATHIPDRITVDVTDREEGHRVSAGELDLPSGAVLVTDPEALVLSVTVPAAPTEDDLAADAQSAEAGAEAGEAVEDEGAADDAAASEGDGGSGSSDDE